GCRRKRAPPAKDARFSREGSSKLSSAWWQSHRNHFTCNGKPQTATVSIDRLEPGSKGTLKPGLAYVQFCVTKGQQTLILSKSGWVKAQAAREAAAAQRRIVSERGVASRPAA